MSAYVNLHGSLQSVVLRQLDLLHSVPRCRAKESGKVWKLNSITVINGNQQDPAGIHSKSTMADGWKIDIPSRNVNLNINGGLCWIIHCYVRLPGGILHKSS